MKALTPIILILFAVGLFFFQINPQYADVKILRAESAQYDEALEVAEELKKLRGDLAQKLASFSPAELQKLERFMPQGLDTVRMILDINGIATGYGITPREIKTTDTPKNLSPDATSGPYNTASISFVFSTSYQNGVDFITDVEKSLRLVDIVQATVKPSLKDETLYDFGLTLNTYWVTKK